MLEKGIGNPLRAEAFGMLAANVFLNLLCDFSNRKEPINVKNIADNKTLIDRCIKHQRYDDLFLNTMLDCERDASEQAFCEVTKSPKIASFEWVRGHQNRDTALNKLSSES